MAACLKDSKSNRAAGAVVICVHHDSENKKFFLFPFYSPSGLTQFSEQSQIKWIIYYCARQLFKLYIIVFVLFLCSTDDYRLFYLTFHHFKSNNMIRKFCQYSLLLFCLSSCSVTTTDDNVVPDTPAISDEIAKGKAGPPTAPTAFVLKTALYSSKTMFGKNGYSFAFYDKSTSCSESLTPPISFFITKLENGTFKGEGPYFYHYIDSKNFGTTSYSGCDVTITKVTATTVEGKVKGGDTKSQYIEGTFTATLCK